MWFVHLRPYLLLSQFCIQNYQWPLLTLPNGTSDEQLQDLDLSGTPIGITTNAFSPHNLKSELGWSRPCFPGAIEG